MRRKCCECAMASLHWNSVSTGRQNGAILHEFSIVHVSYNSKSSKYFPNERIIIVRLIIIIWINFQHFNLIGRIIIIFNCYNDVKFHSDANVKMKMLKLEYWEKKNHELSLENIFRTHRIDRRKMLPIDVSAIGISSDSVRLFTIVLAELSISSVKCYHNDTTM